MSQAEEKSNIFLKKVVVDVVVIIILSIGVYVADHIVPFERGFFCDDESLMYPYKSDTVTVTMLRVVGVVMPFIVFLICEYRTLRNNKAVHVHGVPIPAWIRGFYCVAVAFSIGCCFTELAINTSKAMIGRPRPHFLSICKPSINCSHPEWRGKYVLPTEYTCTGSELDRISDVRKSFLSGHSAFSAFTMFYLAIYLYRRVSFSYNKSIGYMLSFVAILLSWVCALSRVSDYKHHWSDVLAGHVVGILMALVVWVCCTDLAEKERKSEQSESDAAQSEKRTENGAQ